jgi:hypothetical protein
MEGTEDPDQAGVVVVGCARSRSNGQRERVSHLKLVVRPPLWESNRHGLAGVLISTGSCWSVRCVIVTQNVIIFCHIRLAGKTAVRLAKKTADVDADLL